MDWINIINTAQVVTSVLIVGLVLLQEKSSGVGGAFGGGGGSGGGDSGFYQTRRGLEKIVFILTIIAVIAFVILAASHLVLSLK